MKVILPGATGFIGGEILSQASAHPAITSLVCLTQRALSEPAASNPKVKVITSPIFSLTHPTSSRNLRELKVVFGKCCSFPIAYRFKPSVEPTVS
jgi:N-acetyl-gamma-glutamylphosphate reductase